MLFRPRALLAAAILVLPFMAGSFLSALVVELLHEFRARIAVRFDQLLLFIAVVAVLQVPALLLARYVWRSPAEWSLFGIKRRNWLVFLGASYIMGLIAAYAFLPIG